MMVHIHAITRLQNLYLYPIITIRAASAIRLKRCTCLDRVAVAGSRIYIIKSKGRNEISVDLSFTMASMQCKAISNPEQNRKDCQHAIIRLPEKEPVCPAGVWGCNWPGLLGICLIISLKDNPIPAGRSGELWGYNQVILKLPS